VFLGAAAAPFASRPEFQAIREHKKVNAGAQFFQTNLVYDPDGMEIWLNALAKRNILDKVYILIGITPVKSLKMAQYMHNEVPGVVIPDTVMKRLEAAGDGVQEESIQITLEIIERIRQLEGIHGIHLMAVGWEDIVPRIVTEAGLLPPDFVAPEEVEAAAAS
jgi:methylenetetrahydrofolate reductase (NADPH)